VVNKIYDHLGTPRTIKELYERLNEIGLKWNKTQVQLFLQMDKNIVQDGEFYSVSRGDMKEVVLGIIEKTMGSKPIIPIKQIINNIPSDIIISVEEIRKIAVESGNYINPNAAVLKRIN